MSDNDYNPGYSNTLNDIPSQQDVEQKSFNEDDNSAPTVQSYNNNYDKPSYYNNTPINNSQQSTPTNTYGDNNYSNQNIYNNNYNNNNYNNNYNNNNYNNNDYVYNVPEHYVEPQVRRKYRMGENPKLLKIISIILIVIAITGIILQISLDSFSPLILVDNIMGITYLVFMYKKLRLNHRILGTCTILVWFVGFGLEGFGMTQVQKSSFIIANFLATAIRSFAMFFCIPYTCNNYS